MAKFLNNISLEQANDIQFKTTAGANAGKIEQDGNNLVLSNAVGDILLGDGSSDVYIGDGTNNVDIIFEQSGSIKGDGSAVTLTLGGANTTLNLENPNINGNLTIPEKIIHSGDTNTYFGFDLGADTFRVVAGGTEKLKTAAAGIEVNGELQADSLDIDGNADITGNLSLSGDNRILNLAGGTTSSQSKVIIGEQGIYGVAFRWDSSSELDFDGFWATDVTGARNRDLGKVNVNSRLWTFNEHVVVGGELEALSLDINGNADISGALTLGTALAVAEGGTGATNLNALVQTSGDQSVAGNKTFSGGTFFTSATYWQVSGSDYALQRADARDDLTNYSRLHWYGNKDDGTTSNFRHAWYDGGGYIDITAASGTVTFGGAITSTGQITGTELEGTSLDINGTSNISGEATFGGNVTAGSNSLTAGSLDINGNADISGTVSTGVLTATGLKSPYVETNSNASLFLRPNGSGNLYLGDSGNGAKFYHYSHANDGVYSTYQYNGNYYMISTEATSGIYINDPLRVDGAVDINSNVDISGNLTVSGTTTTVNQTNLDVADNIIGLNRGSASNTNDSGIIIERGDVGNNAALIWDEGDDHFILGTTTSDASSTGGSIVVAGGNLKLGGLLLDGKSITGIDNSENFTNADDHIMTSAAIEDKILGYSYTANALPLAGGTMSGAIAMGNNNITGGGTITGTTLTGTSLDINGNADISGTTTLNNTVYFSSTGMITWGGFAGGTGFGIRGESGRALSLGSNGNFDHLIIDTSGNATFAGSVTATGGLIVDGQFTYDTDTGNQPFYITRQGSNAESLSIKVMDSNVIFESIQDETADNYGGFEFRMDGGVTEPDFMIRKGTAAPIFNVRGDGETTFAGDVTINASLDIIRNSNDNQLKLKRNGSATGEFDIYTNTNTLFFKNVATSQIPLGIDGSNNATFAGSVHLNSDSAQLQLGDDNDMQIFHNGANGEISNGTGDLYIENHADDKDIIFQSDNGSGGAAEYFRLDGSATILTTSVDNYFIDNKSAFFGNSGDLRILHDGTYSLIQNNTGNLTIVNRADDADIIFQSDDGSGGVETYFFLDGSASAGNPITVFPDSSFAAWGTGYDLMISHNGTKSQILNQNGNLEIKNTADDGDIIFQSDDGSGGTTAYITLDGSATKTVFSKETLHGDSVKAKFGTSGDLEIQHNGTASIIDNLTGSLLIRCFADDSDIIFQSDDGSGGVTTYFQLDGTNTRTKFSKNVNLQDSVDLYLGTSSDLRLVHNSADSVISNSTGDLYIINSADDKDVIFQSDDGNGGIETYFFLDGSMANSGNNLRYTNFPDDSVLTFGTGTDLRVYHDGTDSIIQNYTGDLEITNTQDDGDIILMSDDGSGGETAYLTLDGSVTRTIFSQEARFTDNVNLKFGSGGDMMMYHDGSNSYIDHTGTGDLLIRQGSNDSDIKFVCDDGSGGLATYLTLDGSAGNIKVYKNMNFQDNDVIQVGTSGDLQIYHDGSNSYIDNSNGIFRITQSVVDGDLVLRADNGSGSPTPYLTLNGGLGYTTVQKHLVFDNGVYTQWANLAIGHDGSNARMYNYVGDMNFINYADDKDIVFQSDDGSGGVETYFYLDGSASSGNPFTVFPDLSELAFGNSRDLRVKHDGSNSSIVNYTGNLSFTQNADGSSLRFNTDDGSGGVTEYFRIDGGAEVNLFLKNARFNDGVKANFGTSDDLQIYHDGSNSYISDAGTGTLYVKTNSFRVRNSGGSEDIIKALEDGAVTLYYDNAAKLATASGGVNVTGAMTATADVVAYSDKKLKENIKTLDGKKVLDMRGVSFTRKDTGEESSGVIAQEIQKVAPELVHDNEGTLGVAYGNLVGYLIEAVKDQQKQIDELKAIINGNSK
jgi:hypothetical protein